MKAALVSATSLAALLAFEVGLDVAIDAQPARAQTFTAENPVLNFGYVLLNTTMTSAVLAETVSATHVGQSITVTFPPVVATPFSGTSVATTLNPGATTTHPYTLSLPSTATLGTHYSLQTTITGSTISGGATLTAKSAVTLSAVAVAPEASTKAGTSSFGAVRIGTTATIAAITVTNIGDGDLYSKTSLPAQLQVHPGTPSNSVFKAGSNLVLNDNSNGTGATVTAPVNYLYAPTTHTIGQTASATVSYLNGAGLTNSVTTSAFTLTGTGVGPIFQSKYGSTTYSNSTNVGHNTITAGTIPVASSTPGATVTTMITLSNVSTDPGSASLTDLTLESFSLSGPNAADFSVVGFTTNTVLAERQSVTVALDFSGPTAGNYDADLSFATDQGVTAGGSGAIFTYLIDPGVIPEPATVLTFGMGLAGLGWARRRRNARPSAIGANTATV